MAVRIDGTLLLRVQVAAPLLRRLSRDLVLLAFAFQLLQSLEVVARSLLPVHVSLVPHLAHYGHPTVIGKQPGAMRW